MLAAFFLNLVSLQPGQAMYLPANEPHAYISGQLMEVLALGPEDALIRLLRSASSAWPLSPQGPEDRTLQPAPLRRYSLHRGHSCRLPAVPVARWTGAPPHLGARVPFPPCAAGNGNVGQRGACWPHA